MFLSTLLRRYRYPAALALMLPVVAFLAATQICSFSNGPDPSAHAQIGGVTPTPQEAAADAPSGSVERATHTSPLGFIISYPKDWSVRTLPELRPGTLRIARDPSAWIDILPDPVPSFQADELFKICGVGDELMKQQGTSVQAQQTMVGGRPAVRCSQTGPVHDGSGSTAMTLVYWVSLPGNGVVHIGALAIDPSPATWSELGTALSTISFEDSER